jgi:hypothetical protein
MTAPCGRHVIVVLHVRARRRDAVVGTSVVGTTVVGAAVGTTYCQGAAREVGGNETAAVRVQSLAPKPVESDTR